MSERRAEILVEIVLSSSGKECGQNRNGRKRHGIGWWDNLNVWSRFWNQTFVSVTVLRRFPFTSDVLCLCECMCAFFRRCCWRLEKPFQPRANGPICISHSQRAGGWELLPALESGLTSSWNWARRRVTGANISVNIKHMSTVRYWTVKCHKMNFI